MKSEKIELYREGEYTYPVKGHFRPFLVSYCHEDGRAHPSLIVVPGGAYRIVSPTEGEIVAKAFYKDGFDTYVLVYTCNLLQDHPLYTRCEDELARAAALVPGRPAVVGFSAGAHLAASCAVHGKADFAAMVLSYPVISMGKYTHADSRRALLGDHPEEKWIAYFSLETQVTQKTPPCFVWHTLTDQSVPPENSFLFARAMAEKKRPVKIRLYPLGSHGMSLANGVWADSDPYPGMYCSLQQQEDVAWCLKHGVPLPERYQGIQPGEDLSAAFNRLQVLRSDHHHPDPVVASWQREAAGFLHHFFSLDSSGKESSKAPGCGTESEEAK